MKIRFCKYSATGNDFIIVDNRQLKLKLDSSYLWQKWCDRRWGIGADGILFLEESNIGFDYRMRYFNGSDGLEAEMCGNGARALAHYAFHELDISHGKKDFKFQTHSGQYQAKVEHDFIELEMTELKDEKKYDLSSFGESGECLFVNTGVPHAVFEVSCLKEFPVAEKGRSIRWDPMFERGTNVNFYEKLQLSKYAMRTFERGVEAETLACGTGAVALAYLIFQKNPHLHKIDIQVPGGSLVVKFDESFKNVWLCGEVKKIFWGEIGDI